MCSRITANERMPLHLHLSGGAMARNRLRSFKFSMTELLWLMETPLGSTLRQQSRIFFLVRWCAQFYQRYLRSFPIPTHTTVCIAAWAKCRQSKNLNEVQIIKVLFSFLKQITQCC